MVLGDSDMWGAGRGPQDITGAVGEPGEAGKRECGQEMA